MNKGFGGMGMNNMLNQIKKIQKEMQKLQEELENKTVEVSLSGGAITVVANGKKEIISIKIDREIVDPEDIEMLEDMVLAAVNEALRKADEMVTSEITKLTGGLNLPGLF